MNPDAAEYIYTHGHSIEYRRSCERFRRRIHDAEIVAWSRGVSRPLEFSHVVRLTIFFTKFVRLNRNQKLR